MYRLALLVLVACATPDADLYLTCQETYDEVCIEEACCEVDMLTGDRECWYSLWSGEVIECGSLCGDGDAERAWAACG